MLSGQVPPGGQGAPGSLGSMFGKGGFGGAPGAAGADPFGSLLGGGLGKQGAPKKSTDAFITDRIPALQKIRRPVMVAFFAYCLYKGWVGRFGFLQGAFSSSYLDMLAVPLRVQPWSPFYQCAYFQSQIMVDTAARLSGFLINVARGKTKIPSIADMKSKFEDLKNLQPPAGGASPFGARGPAAGASPWGAAAGGGSPWADLADAATPSYGQPGGMPTAPTTPLQVPPLQSHPLHGQPPPPPEPSTPSSAAKPVQSRPPSRTPPPVIDADVTFLD